MERQILISSDIQAVIDTKYTMEIRHTSGRTTVYKKMKYEVRPVQIRNGRYARDIIKHVDVRNGHIWVAFLDGRACMRVDVQLKI